MVIFLMMGNSAEFDFKVHILITPGNLCTFHQYQDTVFREMYLDYTCYYYCKSVINHVV